MKKAIINIIPSPISRLIKKIYLTTRGYYYKGSEYKCPICNHNFRKMLPGGFDLESIKENEIIGSGRRDNNICPYCQSTDRDRLVYIYLNQETEIFKQKVKILHISPEPSLYNKIRKFSNIIYETGTKYAEGIYYHDNINSIDLLGLPFSDGEFDMVICNHVLEHIIDDNKAISEIYRVTRNGGSAILQVPISNKLKLTYEDNSITDKKQREIHFGQFDHVRIYGQDYSSKLEKAGFAVQLFYPTNENNSKNEFALNKKEKLHIAHKK